MKLNYSITYSLGSFNKKGFFLKSIFYKKLGHGKIYYNNFFDKSFINSIKDVIFLLKNKYFNVYNFLKKFNIYIKIIPKNYLYSGYSVNLSLFLNFIYLYKEINVFKNIIIIGSVNKYGFLRKLYYIREKFLKIILKNKFIILDENNLNFNKNFFYKNKFNNLNIVTFNSLESLLDVLNIKI